MNHPHKRFVFIYLPQIQPSWSYLLYRSKRPHRLTPLATSPALAGEAFRSRSAAPALRLCEMLADLPRPCRRNNTRRGKLQDHLRERCEVLAHAHRVTGELGGVLDGDAEISYDLRCIDVRTEEDKLPARLLFLPLYQIPQPIRRPVLQARVIRSARDDDEHRTRGVLGVMLVYVPSAADNTAYRIDQHPSTGLAVL